MGRDSPGTLLQCTVRLLAGRDLIKVASDTGLNYHWLVKLARGRVKDPSVNSVQALYEHLVGTALVVKGE